MADYDTDKLKSFSPPKGLPFDIAKIGHVVLKVADLERATEFYTGILGFRVSDVYGEDMAPGGMVFMRCNNDHHGVALVGRGRGEAQQSEMHHMAFEVATIDEVFRARKYLRDHGVKIDFDGRRRAGCQIAVEFRDPDGHHLEIYTSLDQLGPGDTARAPEQWNGVKSLEDAIDNPVEGQQATLRDESLRDDR